MSTLQHPGNTAARLEPKQPTLTARTTPALCLVPVQASAFFVLAAVLALLPLALLAADLTGSPLMPPPAQAPAPWILVTLVPAAALAWWLDLARRRALHLEPDALQVRGFPQAERFNLAELDLERARVLDLEASHDYRPSPWSNHNLATPGLRHGRFRLRNGLRAFVVMSHGSRVLWIPPARHLRGRAPGLLLQPRDPAALLELLRTRATVSAPPDLRARTCP